MNTGYQPHPREQMIRDRLAAASADTTTISEEALRRLNVEAAFGRGAKIDFCSAEQYPGIGFSWCDCTNPIWDWVHFNYRVKGTDATLRRTKAQLLDQIHALLVELRQLDGDA